MPSSDLIAAPEALRADALRLCVRLARFLPIVAFPMLANWIYTLAPVQTRMERGFHDAAGALISGTSIWSTGDLRPLRVAWMTGMPAGKDLLVLGSSRALLISEQWFWPRSMFNAAVPGGDLHDMLAFFRVCVETGRTPRAVVLELNPTLRHDTNALRDDRLLRPYRVRALQRYRSSRSLQYLLDLGSFRKLRWNLQHLRPAPWGIWQAPGALLTHVSPDGTARFQVNESNASPDEREAEVAALIRLTLAGKFRWKTSSEPDARELKLLRAFLDDLQSHGVAVTILLPPIHPAAYESYTRRGGYDESWIRREMGARRIPVVGSYSPWIAKAGNADFYDDVHPHAEILHRILKEAGVIGPR